MVLEMTQFIRPNGRKEQVFCNVSDELLDKVNAIKSKGLRFTAEVIGPNVSFCIENDEEDLACEIVGNGPELFPVLERMIRDFKVPQ